MSVVKIVSGRSAKHRNFPITLLPDGEIDAAKSAILTYQSSP